ncbi:MAG: hypothetical protein K0B37_09820 [Bacteroidales bacterium]|nr:hypothetical protein [Bacteroidales bacterium]
MEIRLGLSLIIDMRRKQNEITDKGIIEDILTGSEVCRIAMMDGDKPFMGRKIIMYFRINRLNLY